MYINDLNATYGKENTQKVKGKKAGKRKKSRGEKPDYVPRPEKPVLNVPRPDGEFTKVAKVKKVLGCCYFDIECEDAVSRLAKVRGRLKYYKERIGKNDYVLVNLRDCDTTYRCKKKCDIIYRYNEYEVKYLTEHQNYWGLNGIFPSFQPERLSSVCERVHIHVPYLLKSKSSDDYHEFTRSLFKKDDYP
tara:strand:- start:60 stop:629 length:570 start_codon:yes stop_codon:yes gene_type:complete